MAFPSRLAVVLVASLSTMCMLPPAVASEQTPATGAHWPRTTTGPKLSLNIQSSLQGTWPAYLKSAVKSWNAGDGSVMSALELTLLSGKEAPSARLACPPSAGKVNMCSANYGETGWLGISTWWLADSHIVQATSRINDFYFGQAPFNTPAWKDMVMCQSLGLTVGLTWQDEEVYNRNSGSCMDMTANPDGDRASPNNRHPNRLDFQQLAALYSHTDAAPNLSRRLMTTVTSHRKEMEQPASHTVRGTIHRAPTAVAVHQNLHGGFSRRLMLSKSMSHAPSHQQHAATAFVYSSADLSMSTYARKLLINTKDAGAGLLTSMVHHNGIHHASTLSEEVTNEPSSWGELVARGPRHLVYRKKVGLNRFVHTEVLLAEDHGSMTNNASQDL